MKIELIQNYKKFCCFYECIDAFINYLLNTIYLILNTDFKYYLLDTIYCYILIIIGGDIMLNKILLRKIKFPLSLRGAFSFCHSRESGNPSSLSLRGAFSFCHSRESGNPSSLSLRGAKQRSNLKGFSLIELMVALAILAMVSLGIFKAYTTSFQVMADAKDRTVAINYAQQRMEFIKNNIPLINTEYKFEAYPDEERKYYLVVDVTSDPTDISLNRVTTNVSWSDRNGKKKEVELEMLVYNPDTSGAPVDPDITSIVLNAYPEDPLYCETSRIEAEVYVGTTLADYSVMVTFFTTPPGTLSYKDVFTINGIATVNLNNLTSENSTAIVTGIVGALADTVSVDWTPPALLLTAVPEVIFYGETSTITAVLTGKGEPMSGKPIEFSITSGNGLLNGESSSISVETNEAGEATVVLSGVEVGTQVKIEASYCGVDAIPVTIDCLELIIDASASNDIIPPGADSTITALLTEKGSGKPVSGKTIIFSTDNWMISPTNVVTDGNGKATALLSNSSIGEATVTATYGTLSDTVTVNCVSMILTIDAAPIVVQPGESSTITAILKDSSGNPIVGKSITFISATGTGELSSETATTNAQGEANVNIVFSVPEVGVNKVTAEYLTLSKDVDITCTQYQISVDAEFPEVYVGVPCTITATLKNGGSPVSGKTINFGTVNGGTLTFNSAVTGTNGQAEVDLSFVKVDEGKTATVTATYTSVSPVFEISDTTTVTCKIKKDFKVIHGNSVILSGNRTLTLRNNSVDYTLEPGVTTEDCFVRIVNTRLTGIGRTSGGGSQNLDDYTVQISNPQNILTSFNFDRVGSTNNCRVTWEIIQYIGAEGGANEIKVRTAVGGLSTTATAISGASLSNISNINKAVIYITGQSGSNTGTGEWNECLFTSDFIASGSNWIPRFSRGRSSDTGRVSYAVVEFTGSNWRNIQRITFNSRGSTVTILPPLLDTTKTFLHCQYRYVTNTYTDSGLDDCGETVEVLSTTQLTSRRRPTTGTDASSKYHVVWVIENTQSTGKRMIVQHVSGTRTDNSGSEEHVWSEAINGVRALDEASIQGETLASYDSGTAYPIGSEGLVITSTTNLNRIQSDMGQDCYYAHCIVQFPTVD
jgi:prepilin-type N-terminal cleavage/methylation domain-containing protein